MANGVKPEDYGRALELLLRRSTGLDNEVDLSKSATVVQGAGGCRIGHRSTVLVRGFPRVQSIVDPENWTTG